LQEANALEDHFASRLATISGHSEFDAAAPQVQSVTTSTSTGSWTNPLANESFTIEATASAGNTANGAANLVLHWSNALEGNFDALTMDLVEGDAELATYTATLPGMGAGSVLRFYFEAIENDATETRSYEPAGAEHDVYFFHVEPVMNPNGSEVVINEAQAKNNMTAYDEAGESDDWIELFNNGSSAIDLTGWYLTDNPWNVTKWPLPEGAQIGPGEYLIVWADEDGSQGDWHANFKLSSSGELLWLMGPDGMIQDAVNFPELATDEAYARVPNGTGDFIVQGPTHGVNNANVGVDHHSGSSPFAMYPSPVRAGALFRVDCASDWKLAFYDLSGKCVKTCTSFEPTIQAPEAAGVYFLHWDAATMSGTTRLMVVD